VVLWSLRDGSRRILSVGPLEFVSVSFTPDGRYVAAGDLDGICWIWDVRTGHLVTKCELVPAKGGLQVLFTPDGKGVATGGDTLQCWDFSLIKDIRSRREDIPSLLKQNFKFNDSKLEVCFFSCIHSQCRF
jgi:WD40 repeat protein